MASKKQRKKQKQVERISVDEAIDLAHAEAMAILTSRMPLDPPAQKAADGVFKKTIGFYLNKYRAAAVLVWDKRGIKAYAWQRVREIQTAARKLAVAEGAGTRVSAAHIRTASDQVIQKNRLTCPKELQPNPPKTKKAKQKTGGVPLHGLLCEGY